MFPTKTLAIFIFIGILFCFSGGLLAQGGPSLVITEPALNFGTVGDGVSSEMYVHVRAQNPYSVPTPGIQSVVVTGMGFTNDYYSVPHLFYDMSYSTINVNFDPSGPGTYNGMLTITDMVGMTYDVPLSGEQIAPTPEPYLVINPYPFTKTLQENGSGYKQATFLNVGTADLIFTVPEDSLPSWLSFTGGEISGKSSRVGPITLVPGDSTLINIWFYCHDLLPGNYMHILNVATNNPTMTTTPWIVNLEVTPLPVSADFRASPLLASLSSEIQFTDITRVDSTLTGLFLVAWEWDLDGNGTIDSFEPNPLYTYSEVGTYSPSLTVYANTGYSSYKDKANYITITNDPPVLYNPIDSLTINEDSTWGPHQFTDYFSDSDGDMMTFGAESSGQISVIHDNYNFRIIPKTNWSGVQTVSISATDGHSTPVVHEIVVTVLPVNDPPSLNIPADFYFIRNAPFIVDFGQYINDPDTPLSEIWIQINRVGGTLGVNYDYSANTPGQLSATFTNAAGQWNISNNFQISVMDNMTTATNDNFTMHVLEHFNAQFSADVSIHLAGQTINFSDTTLGNPNWWLWDFNNDGTPDSNLQHPVFAYQFAGTYSVRLTLGNAIADEQASYFWENMFTIQGTALADDAVLPPVLPIQGSPYNLMGDFNIPPGGTTINPDVELNFLGGDPVPLNGPLFATGVDFQAPPGGTWGGFIFNPGSQGGSFSNCRILGANLPLQLDGYVPTIVDSLVIVANADTTQFFDGPGVILGGSNPHLHNIHLYNYRGGIRLQNNTRTVSTPTLTNIRIRNSSESSRDEADNTGIFLDGEIDATLENIEIENCGMGIKFVNDNRVETTPTLTNIRIRNSSEASRGIYKGIVVEGAVAVSMDDIEIKEVQTGIDLQPNISEIRTTPTLTNIRVRNSSESSRTESTGIRISNIPTIVLSDIETNDLGTGIDISQQLRTGSTPTLTNIRVRNSSEASRAIDYGIKISGDVIASMDDIVTEFCSYGIVYDMSGVAVRTGTTPTLTNIRVRNSSETQRGEVFGFVFTDLASFRAENDSLGNCTKAIQILNSQRTVSTPTLTNIRIRNSSETQRIDNIGIYLEGGMTARIENCDIKGALVGIQIDNGAVADLGPNLITNCAAGIKAWSNDIFDISHQTIALEPAFMIEHFDWNYRALDLSYAGPFQIFNNTIHNYPRLVNASGAEVLFYHNIGWAAIPLMQPFSIANGNLTEFFNDVFTSPPLPGQGDISLYPAFMDPADLDFRLTYASPCIDAGDPGAPPDSDGTTPDLGAWPYLHKASFSSDVRFIQTGTTVHFTNNSLGHDVDQVSTVMWDLNDDGTDATTRDWEHTFTQPGLYDLKLTMQTGSLVDEMLVIRAIVVQNMLLQAPVINEITVNGDNVGISWLPVTENIDHEQVTVNYYLVYSCDTPDGMFNYRGFTENPVTNFSHLGGATHSKQFYFVLGYYGTRGELESFILSNKQLGADGRKIGSREARK